MKIRHTLFYHESFIANFEKIFVQIICPIKLNLPVKTLKGLVTFFLIWKFSLHFNNYLHNKTFSLIYCTIPIKEKGLTLEVFFLNFFSLHHK